MFLKHDGEEKWKSRQKVEASTSKSSKSINIEK